MIPYYAIAAVGLILIILIIVLISRRRPPTQWYSPPSPSDIAGIEGERYARNRIREILRPDDQLFSNVAVSYDGREAELDNVIVNPFGVFIVEVKNYSGTLAGDADDFEWEKLHMSQGGNIYQDGEEPDPAGEKADLHSGQISGLLRGTHLGRRICLYVRCRKPGGR